VIRVFDANSVFRWAQWLLFAVLAFFTAIALFDAAAGSFFRIPQNFNEGWNAYFAEAALSGDLYQPPDAWVTNNYPPLSFYLIGWLARPFGDPVFIGRFLSGAGLLGVAVNIYAIQRCLRLDRYMALCVAVAFLGFVAIGFPNYVAANAPQVFAHGVMTTALTVFLCGYRRRGFLLLSALLMLAAGMIKHNLLPIPLAVAIWLFLQDRRAFVFWIGCSAAALALAAAAIWLLHGAAAFEAILLLQRQYRSIPVAGALYQFVLPTLPLYVPIFFSGILADRHVRLIAIYLAVALVWSLYTMSAVGVAQNGILDYLIALSILAGLALGQLAGRGLLYAVALLTLPVALMAAQLQKPHRALESLQRQAAEYRDDIAFLRSVEGPALCHSTAVCYWAGKAFEYDPFNTVRKMHLYPEFRARMIRRMDKKYFAVLQIYKFDVFPADFAEAVARNYELAHRSATGWRYYRRR
jgi:hypothetical protein